MVATFVQEDGIDIRNSYDQLDQILARKSSLREQNTWLSARRACPVDCSSRRSAPIGSLGSSILSGSANRFSLLTVFGNESYTLLGLQSCLRSRDVSRNFVLPASFSLRLLPRSCSLVLFPNRKFKNFVNITDEILAIEFPT